MKKATTQRPCAKFAPWPYNAWAQTLLGSLYDDGQGVAQDYQEAVKWYRLAAMQGNALAQSNLGMMYSNGQGVAQDY